MSSSLSSLVDNLSEGLHNGNCTDCKSDLDYTSIKDDQLIFMCFDCKKNYKKDFNKELIKRFGNLYKFCDGDINKFILLLRKGVYAYEYTDSWKRFDETLPDKKEFYSINKFILLLRKGVYAYEYMDSWKRFDETSPDKKEFYSILNMEDIQVLIIGMQKSI